MNINVLVNKNKNQVTGGTKKNAEQKEKMIY